MRKPVAALEISVGQRELLESVARSQSGAHREVIRAKALLMASQGTANTAIAQALSVASVANWRARFAEDGLARLGQVRKGRGRKPSIPQAKIDEILDLTQNYRPPRARPTGAADDGRGGRGLEGHGAPGVVGTRFEAARTKSPRCKPWTAPRHRCR
jgi:hypothetical protein